MSYGGPDSASETKGYTGDGDLVTTSIRYSVSGKNHTLAFGYGMDGDWLPEGASHSIDGDLMLPGGVSHSSFVEKLNEEERKNLVWAL